MYKLVLIRHGESTWNKENRFTGWTDVDLSEKGILEAHEAGRLLGMTKTSDVVDAVVVTTALRQKATILTSDPDDIERLVKASGREVAVVAI